MRYLDETGESPSVLTGDDWTVDILAEANPCQPAEVCGVVSSAQQEDQENERDRDSDQPQQNGHAMFLSVLRRY
jgi:hypothetical protein